MNARVSAGRVTAITFGSLQTGAEFYDKWTKARFVKQDHHGALEVMRDDKGKHTREYDCVPCGFKADEEVVPIY